jgi:hypothetical protein
VIGDAKALDVVHGQDTRRGQGPADFRDGHLAGFKEVLAEAVGVMPFLAKVQRALHDCSSSATMPVKSYSSP